MSNTLIIYLLTASLIAFILTLIFIPILIVRIPSNYFQNEMPPESEKWNIPNSLRIVFLVLKNILGSILFLGGFIMLFTPGQGILSMLIGLSLTNFPGKRKLERKIVSNARVFHSINWIRKKSGTSPINKPIFK